MSPLNQCCACGEDFASLAAFDAYFEQAGRCPVRLPPDVRAQARQLGERQPRPLANAGAGSEGGGDSQPLPPSRLDRPSELSLSVLSLPDRKKERVPGFGNGRPFRVERPR